MRDEEAWMFWGNYGFSALQTVMAHFGSGLSGKKSNAKYIDKPVMQKAAEEQFAAELTEEEKKKQTEQLFMRLRIMEANFNSKKKGEKK